MLIFLGESSWPIVWHRNIPEGKRQVWKKCRTRETVLDVFEFSNLSIYTFQGWCCLAKINCLAVLKLITFRIIKDPPRLAVSYKSLANSMKAGCVKQQGYKKRPVSTSKKRLSQPWNLPRVMTGDIKT